MILSGAMDDYLDFSPSAQRLLALCVERVDKNALAPLSRRGAADHLHLSEMTAQAAVEQLKDKGFLAQAGQGLLVLNFTKVAVTTRYLDGDAELLANFHRHKEGWAASFARKSQAGKLAATQRPPTRRWGMPREEEGAEHGVVEEESDEEGGAQ